MQRSGLQPFGAFANGVRHWQTELLAYLVEPTTNGYAEGVRIERRDRVNRPGYATRARALAVIASAFVAPAVSGCGGGDMPLATKTTIVLVESAYIPAHVRIAPGDRITFVNTGSRINTAETEGSPSFAFDRESLHRRGQFDTHVLHPGEAETLVLKRPGRYSFHSSLDRDMHGTIDVVPRDDR